MANPRPDEKQAEQQRPERGGSQTGSARENIRSISDAGSRIAGSAADMSQRAAQTGVEMLDRNKETVQELWEHSTELFAHVARQSTDQMGRLLGISGESAEDGARRTSRSLDALLQSSDVIASASRDLSREWFDTMRRVLDATVSRSDSLASCRTPNDLFAMQLEITRDTVQATLQGAKRLSEISAQAASEATQKMSDAAKRAA
jgi:chemotaxis regulatin CheY-phosphate phosphatase CheZ